MQCISDDARPCTQYGDGAEGFGIGGKFSSVGSHGIRQNQRIRQCAAGIGKQHFLGKTGGKAGNTFGNFRLTLFTTEQFLIDGVIADDGASNALVIQCRVQQHIPVILLGMDFLAVHIHHIGQQLEGVEGNTDGQSDLFDKFGDFAEDGAEQSRILEVTDQQNVHCAVDQQPQLFLLGRSTLFHLQGAEPGTQRHKHQQQNVLRLTPDVENQRENQ